MRRPRPLRAALVVAFLAWAIATMVSACREPTQMVISFKTNACADNPQLGIVSAPGFLAAQSRIEAKSLNAAHAGGCIGPDTLGTLTVTPGDSFDGATVVAVVGLRNKSPEACAAAPAERGCIIARRQFSFIEHEPLALTINLDLSCEGVACNAFTTCEGGSCVDARVECAGRQCSEPGKRLDGGTVSPPDAALVDTGFERDPSDAQTDGAPIIDGGGSLCPAAGDCRGDRCSGTTCCMEPSTEKCTTDLDGCQDSFLWGCCAMDAPCPMGFECCFKKGTASACVPSGQCGDPRLCTTSAQCRPTESCNATPPSDYPSTFKVRAGAPGGGYCGASGGTSSSGGGSSSSSGGSSSGSSSSNGGASSSTGGMR